MLGGVLVVAGAAVLVHAFARFVVEGLGTPAPVAPTEQLVVGGLYRYVRNPMYVAVVGDDRRAGAAARPARCCWSTPRSCGSRSPRSSVYEEPTLADRYGAQYEAYRRAVPAGGRGSAGHVRAALHLGVEALPDAVGDADDDLVGALAVVGVAAADLERAVGGAAHASRPTSSRRPS